MSKNYEMTDFVPIHGPIMCPMMQPMMQPIQQPMMMYPCHMMMNSMGMQQPSMFPHENWYENEESSED